MSRVNWKRSTEDVGEQDAVGLGEGELVVLTSFFFLSVASWIGESREREAGTGVLMPRQRERQPRFRRASLGVAFVPVAGLELVFFALDDGTRLV